MNADRNGISTFTADHAIITDRAEHIERTFVPSSLSVKSVTDFTDGKSAIRQVEIIVQYMTTDCGSAALATLPDCGIVGVGADGWLGLASRAKR